MTAYTIDGSAIEGIDDLYGQLDRLLMADEDWRLGSSLDALNDLLYRAEGDTGSEPVHVVWTDHARSRAVLGRDATRRWLQAKLERPDVFAADRIRSQLAELKSGAGPTYFELVLEVFADHPRIVLDLR